MTDRFRPGEDTWIASDSDSSSYSAVFEDDEDTGYFYACEVEGSARRILDACHIYNVSDLAETDRSRESTAEIRWSKDGLKAGLLINGRVHSVINFAEMKAYCRTNFPPPGRMWQAKVRAPWRDTLVKLLE